jgi:hypothetical protein
VRQQRMVGRNQRAQNFAHPAHSSRGSLHSPAKFGSGTGHEWVAIIRTQVKAKCIILNSVWGYCRANGDQVTSGGISNARAGRASPECVARAPSPVIGH